MEPLVRPLPTAHTPQSLARTLRGRGGLVLLESALRRPGQERFSFVAAAPFLVFRAYGARCELLGPATAQVLYGNPWHILERLQARFELTGGDDLPFPAGGCFGFWGYELRQFVEPVLRPHPNHTPEVPDCWLGFYDRLVVFDHAASRCWAVSTGLLPDGSRDPALARSGLDDLSAVIESAPAPDTRPHRRGRVLPGLSAGAYEDIVREALRLIRAGDIYQVNLAQRWQCFGETDPWALYRELTASSPAPFAAFVEGEDFALASSSPELFLRIDGRHIRTRPIKGTRPRGVETGRQAALARELCSSPKERAELTMITDLLRNDLGRVCEYGSVHVPELARLESFSHVQHLVATVDGRLRDGVSQLEALARCFPGGSVTGAPKIRAMQIIDALEPEARGPYTGALGYLGFNQRSQLSIIIRSAVWRPGVVTYHAGAGIVAESDPAAEHAETLAKAAALGEVLDNAGPGGALSVPLSASELVA